MPAFAPRGALAILLGALALSVSACGVGDPTGGITSRVGQARNAQTITSLQMALVTASTAATDGSAAQGAALAAQLQSRDPSSTYSAALPTAPGQVQVVGGGSGPVLLVGYSEQEGGRPGYVAAWHSGPSTRWYAGPQPPGYTPSEPSGAGWSTAAPVAATVPVSSGG